MGDKVAGPAPVIPIGAAAKGKKALTPGKAKKESEKIWGRAVMARGFLIIPALLLRAQARLGLDGRQLAILLHLAVHWWKAGERPYPAKKTIAERMRLSTRQVQRAIAAMEKHGLVRRIPRRSVQGGGMTNFYDLSGLVAKLQALEPEFRKADEEARAARARRRALERPGRRASAAMAE
jgi:hypothetical protein